MQQRKPLLMTAMGVLFALAWASILTPVMSAQKAEKPAAAGEEMVTWQLSNSKVAQRGTTSKTTEGVLVNGHVVEADATASDGAPFKKGLFRLIFSVFSPSVDMPGQRAGFWYLKGNWTISDEKAPPGARKARYSAALLKGTLTAELSFNPVSDRGNIDAQVLMPMSPQGGRWARGSGAFTGNEQFSGEISVTLEQRPEIK